MRIRNVRRGVPAVLLVGAGLALAACGSSDGSSSASASSSTSGPASVSSTPSVPATVSGSTSGSASSPAASSGASGGTGGSGSSATPTGTSEPRSAAGSAEPACATSRLKTTTTGMNSGAGSTMFTLVFQNTGSRPCTLRGYPGVSFVNGHGVQLGKAAARTGGATPVVTLIPNAHAYADVRTVNGEGGYDASACDLTTVPALRIYPPNQTASTDIPWNTKECVGPSVQNLEVGPVHGNK